MVPTYLRGYCVRMTQPSTRNEDEEMIVLSTREDPKIEECSSLSVSRETIIIESIF